MRALQAPAPRALPAALSRFLVDGVEMLVAVPKRERLEQPARR
jgi:hypothetical protein